MPITFFTSVTFDVVYARWMGCISAEVIRENFEAYLNDANYRPGRREVIDASGVEEIDMDSRRARDFLLWIGARLPEMGKETSTAIIAPGDAMFGLARMYQQLAERAGVLRVSVSRGESDALAAIDLPFDTIAQMLSQGGFLPARRLCAPDQAAP